MKRCQLKQSFRHAIKIGLTDNLSFGKFVYDNHDEDNNTERSVIVDWCKFNGIRYNVNNVLIHDVINDIPEYYLIKKIILNDNSDDMLYDCIYLDIVDYYSHLRAYKVVKTKRSKIIAYRDLYTNVASVIYKVNSECYVRVDF